MTVSLLSEIIRYVRSHTAFRAWLVGILILFVVCTLGRCAIAVWLGWDNPTASPRHRECNPSFQFTAPPLPTS